MIRVSVELVPFGDERRASVLTQILISNICPTSEAEALDEWGERWYRVECGDISLQVRHRRGDGSDVLVSRAFAVLAGIEQQEGEKP